MHAPATYDADHFGSLTELHFTQDRYLVMDFASLPDRRAERDPQGPSVSDGRRSLTNAQFLHRVRAAARHLEDLGVESGDVVALKLTNRAEFVLLLFASWRLGATVTPVNPKLTDVEVARQLADSGARLVVVEDSTRAEDGVVTLAVDDLYEVTAGEDRASDPDPTALALLIYTSGTTGVPKGVMLDHANIDAMTEMASKALELGPADRSLLILPLFHVFGVVVSVLTPLVVGACVVIADRFDPHTFFDIIERERPTFFSAVPTIYNMLAALPDAVRPDTSSVRYGICGSAPAPAELLTRFEARYGFPLLEGYGLSETSCACTVNPLAGPRRAGTVGLPFPGQEIRIVDESGRALAPGENGEVLVRGANVMRGYLGRADETATTIVDGWLHTGDVGHLDADGYLTLAGRSKDVIIRGGENIYPKEIEDVLAGDPSVLEVAVIGEPNEKWGEVVVAYVQPVSGRSVDPTELEALCARSLSGYKRPTAYFVVEAIPTNAVGKIDKISLHAAHAAASAGA
ncbi:AMP-binding protein [Streptomyces sp. ME02-8801-2C]|uniref:class I adenylate-forming enzyme family protein n=1 Tax=Streptomyces sp. ME02-8801-2C TaxID=3028680 RepID=UPI0029A263A0|nr:AMP-binding protein [Streptomyces sp. ME02-8801-2C]MDX3452051.1 AMP-binding protein [Streptomyces sp. ME02-8801-2C]